MLASPKLKMKMMLMGPWFFPASEKGLRFDELPNTVRQIAISDQAPRVAF